MSEKATKTDLTHLGELFDSIYLCTLTVILFSMNLILGTCWFFTTLGRTCLSHYALACVYLSVLMLKSIVEGFCSLLGLHGL